MSSKREILNNIFNQIKGFNITEEVSKSDLVYAMSKIYTPGPSFHALFDFSLKKVVYVSPEIKSVLGVDMKDNDVGDLMDLIHIDDFDHIRNCQSIADAFFHDFKGVEASAHYKRSYMYRMMHTDGQYRLMLHQSVMLLSKGEKIAGKSFVYLTDISHFSKVRNDGISFIDLTGHDSYHNIENMVQLNQHVEIAQELSSREIEILILLSEGFKSKDIASELNISYDTVRTHRNNILKRHDFNNISHAMAYYLRKGVL